MNPTFICLLTLPLVISAQGSVGEAGQQTGNAFGGAGQQTGNAWQSGNIVQAGQQTGTAFGNAGEQTGQAWSGSGQPSGQQVDPLPGPAPDTGPAPGTGPASGTGPAPGTGPGPAIGGSGPGTGSGTLLETSDMPVVPEGTATTVFNGFSFDCGPKRGLQTMGYGRYMASSDTDFDYKFACTDFLQDSQNGNLGSETCWDTQDYKFTDTLSGAAGKLDMSCNDNEYVRAVNSRYDAAAKRTLRLKCCKLSNVETRNCYLSKPVKLTDGPVRGVIRSIHRKHAGRPNEAINDIVLGPSGMQTKYCSYKVQGVSYTGEHSMSQLDGVEKQEATTIPQPIVTNTAPTSQLSTASPIDAGPQAQADTISNLLNNPFKSQLMDLRGSSGNANPNDSQLQQLLQLFGHPTLNTGNALNSELQNFDFATYATPARVQAAPAQAQAFQNTLTGQFNQNNFVNALLAWNAAAPVVG